jgi:NADPH:quinone reductase
MGTVLTLGVRVVLGARVIACASPSKLDVARTFGGADFVVDYTKDGWQKEVLKITGGRGVDVVYDPVGRIKGMNATCAGAVTSS